MIEIIKKLAKSTKELFHLLGYTNIYARTGNGYKRWSEVGPFDAIIITAAIDHIIDDLLCHLKVGGRMIMPLKVNKIDQVLIRITKLDANDNYKKEELMSVMFVPMTGNK